MISTRETAIADLLAVLASVPGMCYRRSSGWEL